MKTSVNLIPVQRLQAEVIAPELIESLVALDSRASCPAACVDYVGLIRACRDAISPVIEGLLTLRYDLWLLMAGAELSSERRQAIPHYSLFSRALKYRLEKGQFVERHYGRPGRIRTAGLYQVRADRYADAFHFMTENSWALGIMSRRPELPTSDSLDAVYRVAALDKDGKEQRSLDWLSLSALQAPLGDVVVQTVGGFDDKYRRLILTCSRSSAAVSLFDAVIVRTQRSERH